MIRVRLFGPLADAAGTRVIELEATSLDAALEGARRRFSETYRDLESHCRVWVNGEPASGDVALVAGDEVALLPPVSGG